MSLQAQYKKFEKKIALSRQSDEYKEAREKDDLITPKVEQAFKDEGYKVDGNFLQGSLSTHTGIIPLDGDYDIDRAIAITKSSSPDNPVEPKKIVKSVLSSHGFKEPKIKKPCVTADYKTKPLHIDYPIYRKSLLGSYELAIGKEHSNEENRCWDEADPKKLTDWITSDKDHMSWLGLSTLTDEERRQFYRLVKYLKRWRDVKYESDAERKKVYSIALTVMTKESFKPEIDDDTGQENDHASLKSTIENILKDGQYFHENGDGHKIVVDLPVKPFRDIYNDTGKTAGTILRRRLNKLLAALNKVDEKDTLKEQCDLLREHFGDDFPEQEESQSSKSNSRATSASPGLVGVSNGA
jgi:hypothetical protein